MIPKRKYYLFCEMDSINGKNQYWYNAEEKNLRIHPYEDNEEKGKILRKTWTYPFILVLQGFAKAYDIPLASWPFSTAIVTGIATILAMQFGFFPCTTKLFDPIEPLDITKDEMATLATLGKSQLKKTPWIFFIAVIGFFFFSALDIYINNRMDTVYIYISEIAVGFLVPMIFIGTAPIYRTKLYRSIIRGE